MYYYLLPSEAWSQDWAYFIGHVKKGLRKNTSLICYSGRTCGTWQAMCFSIFTANSIHSIQERQESVRKSETSVKMTEDSRVKREKEIELMNVFSKNRWANWIYSGSSFTRSFLAESLCNEPETRRSNTVFCKQKYLKKENRFITCQLIKPLMDLVS